MADVRLVLRDQEREIHAMRDAEFAECVVAALSAEPETIEELDSALDRFVTTSEWSNFRGFIPGAEDVSHGSGIVIIDLPGRLVLSDFLFAEPATDQEPEVADAEQADPTDDEDFFDEPRPLWRLSDDWLLTDNVADWRGLAEARRAERLANPPLDARAVLYGEPLLAFIARECWDTCRDVPLPIGSVDDPTGSHAAYDEDQELLRPIHARWMMTPRDDLRGKTPREVMHEKRDQIAWDIQDRSHQWSHEGTCPRGLDEESAAYRFSGFGTHEMVVYYDMVRYLLRVCRGDVADQTPRPDPVRVRERGVETLSDQGAALTAGDFLTYEVPRLAEAREEWLDEPDPEFSGRTPRSIIHNERARLPEGMSGHEMVIDDDCPLCQMQAELPGVGFWFLDGCNMDDEFAFSIYHRTLEEWEEEQRRHEEFSRRFEAEQAERERLGVAYPGSGYESPESAWKRSFSAAESPGQSVLMRLFAIGTHLTELIVDLKDHVGPSAAADGHASATDNTQPVEGQPAEVQPEARTLIDRLSRDFDNLREVAQSRDFATAESLIEPVLERFCETLDTVAEQRRHLEPKCADLRARLERFLATAGETDDASEMDDLPF